MNDHAPQPRRLSALLVNQQSGAHALACIESLKREWNRTRRMGLDLEIVCVDDPGVNDQSSELTQLRRLGVKVLENREWRGFAASVELALEHTSGSPDDHVCILTPEVVFLPGSIDPLLDTLELEPSCGAIAPRASVDIEGTLALPPPVGLDPDEYQERCRARVHERRARHFASKRHERSALWWNATEPFSADVLEWPLFLRRELVHRFGLLLDERFVTAFCRLDLCERIRAAGFELLHQPESRVLRRWQRASELDLSTIEDPDYRTVWLEDRAQFLELHAGRRALGAVSRADKLVEGAAESDLDPEVHDFLDLGVFEHAPSALIAIDGEYVLELSFAPTFQDAAGMLAEGDCWTITDEAWEWLVQGRYWARALDPDGTLVGAWTFVKATRARNEAWQPGELAREFEAAWPLDGNLGGPAEALFG